MKSVFILLFLSNCAMATPYEVLNEKPFTVTQTHLSKSGRVELTSCFYVRDATTSKEMMLCQSELTDVNLKIQDFNFEKIKEEAKSKFTLYHLTAGVGAVTAAFLGPAFLVLAVAGGGGIIHTIWDLHTNYKIKDSIQKEGLAPGEYRFFVFNTLEEQEAFLNNVRIAVKNLRNHSNSQYQPLQPNNYP